MIAHILIFCFENGTEAKSLAKSPEGAFIKSQEKFYSECGMNLEIFQKIPLAKHPLEHLKSI